MRWELHLCCRSWREMSNSSTCTAACFLSCLPSQTGHAFLLVSVHIICISSLRPCFTNDLAECRIKALTWGERRRRRPVHVHASADSRWGQGFGEVVAQLCDTWRTTNKLQHTHHREARVLNCKKWKKEKKRERGERAEVELCGGRFQRKDVRTAKNSDSASISAITKQGLTHDWKRRRTEITYTKSHAVTHACINIS